MPVTQAHKRALAAEAGASTHDAAELRRGFSATAHEEQRADQQQAEQRDHAPGARGRNGGLLARPVAKIAGVVPSAVKISIDFGA